MKSIFVIVLLLATLASPALTEDKACDMLFVQDAKAMIFVNMEGSTNGLFYRLSCM